MHGLFLLICLFSDLFASVASFLLGIDHSLFLYGCCAFTFVYSIFMAFTTRNDFLPPNIFRIYAISIFFVFAILLSMFITELYYDISDKLFSGMILSFGSKGLVAPLLAMSWNKRNYIDSVVKWIVPFTFFTTVGSLFAIQQLGNQSYLYIEIGRQLMSYGGAISIGLLLFYLCYSSVGVAKSIAKLIAFVLIALNIVILVFGGGKGAFVLACLLFIVFFYAKLKKKIFVLLLTLFAGLTIGSSYLTNVISQSSGGKRILALFFSNSIEEISSGRNELYEKALNITMDRYFLGGGTGSVINDIGFYSHNIFLDILLDWGFIGLFFCIGLIVNVCRKSLLMQNDKNIFFLFLVFLTQFVLLLFSSSLYLNFGFWFSSFAILSYYKEGSLKYEK